MLRFLLNRVGLLIPTFIGVSIIAFSFIRLLPGDPILLLAGERGMTAERYQAEVVKYGFDEPIWRQYLNYLGDLLQGDFGTSFVTKKPVLTEFLTLFPATLELSIVAIVLAVAIGVAYWTAILQRRLAEP